MLGKLCIQLDKKLGDQIILADFGGFLAIGGFFGRNITCQTQGVS